MAVLAEALLSDQERRVVERIVDRLRADLGDDLQAVWLFGSRARNEHTGPESDVDLLAITAPGTAVALNAAWRLAGEVAGAEGADGFAYDLRVWDSDWLANRREIRSFFVQEVDRDKIVLWGSA